MVYFNTLGVNKWLVDPATLSEIVAMSNGYVISDGWEIKDTQVSGQEVAKAWLAQFIKVTKNKKVTPITYGNPSSFWASKSLKKTPSDNLCVGSDIFTTWAAFVFGIKNKLDKKINIDKVKNFLTELIFQI